MFKDKLDNQVCDACGVDGEIGYLIQDGDEVATVLIAEKRPITSKSANY
ncbi:TPA: hypothetical protein ACYHN4_002851 [Vibrio cholerae]